MKRTAIIAVCILAGAVALASAASFKLESGEKIKGKMFVLNPEEARIRTDYGTVTVPFGKIVEMDFSGESLEYHFILNDASLVKGNLISYSEGMFTVNTTAGIITIGAKSVRECAEAGYADQLKRDKADEEMARAQSRVNQIRLTGGYGLILGDFSERYNSGIQMTLGYDRPFFSGTLRALRFGVLAGYESLPAQSVTGVSLDAITLAATVRYVFTLTTADFWSRFLPFAQFGAGGSLVRLNYANGTSEAGLNPALIGAAGVDFAVLSWLDVSLSVNYRGILESTVSLHEIWFGGGVVFKF